MIAGMPASEDSVSSEAAVRLDANLARFEWEHVQRVLAICSGNKSETARRLGITRRTLQRKLKTTPTPR